MDLPHPTSVSYTIYTKSGCLSCTKVKDLLKPAHPELVLVDCDDYLLENKEEFLQHMKTLIGYECKAFPMVFKNGLFVGGYTETKKDYDQSQILGQSSDADF